MNRKILFRVAAMVAAVLAPLAAGAQVSPDTGKNSGPSEATYKYEAYLGGAYSRIRQVPASYSGLIGGRASLARNWGKYFQLTGSVDYYQVGTGHSGIPSPGKPSVYTVLAAPGLHMTLFGNLSGLVFAELGAEHTGGEYMTPNISVAGGFGGGLSYSLRPNLAVQLTGDRLGASFPLPDESTKLGYSTHRTWNVRGTIGVVYRF